MRTFSRISGVGDRSVVERISTVCVITDSPENPTVNPHSTIPLIPPISAAHFAPEVNSRIAEITAYRTSEKLDDRMNKRRVEHKTLKNTT